MLRHERFLKKTNSKERNKMPAKKKSAKSAKKVRDLKPSKDAKGGSGPGIKPNPVIGSNRKNLY